MGGGATPTGETATCAAGAAAGSGKRGFTTAESKYQMEIRKTLKAGSFTFSRSSPFKYKNNRDETERTYLRLSLRLMMPSHFFAVPVIRLKNRSKNYPVHTSSPGVNCGGLLR